MSKKEQNNSSESFNTISLCENGNSYQLTMALPEMDKNKVKIILEDNYLVVKTKGSQEENSELKNAHVFQKYELPANADTSKIKAQMNNGILSVCVSKKK